MVNNILFLYLKCLIENYAKLLNLTLDLMVLNLKVLEFPRIKSITKEKNMKEISFQEWKKLPKEKAINYMLKQLHSDKVKHNRNPTLFGYDKQFSKKETRGVQINNAVNYLTL